MEPETHQNFPPSRSSPPLSSTLEFLLPDWAALVPVVTWKHTAQAGECQEEVRMSRRCILTFFSCPRFSSLLLLAAQSRAYTLLQRHPHTRTWLLVQRCVVNGDNNELTFQIHFNEVKNCDSVLFNLAQRQLLLCYRDKNTHWRMHTQTNYDGERWTHLRYVAAWWPRSMSSWRSQHPGRSGLVRYLSCV